MFTLRHLHSTLGFMVLLCFVAQDAAAQDIQSAQVDLTGLTLEQLLTVEVSSASKYSQPRGEAPSAVQVISR